MENLCFIDFQIKSNCWNLMDSYGGICIYCGFCAADKKKRYEARLRCLKRWLEERENFDGWAVDDPELLETQKKNVADDVRYFKRRIRYYEGKLKKLADSASQTINLM